MKKYILLVLILAGVPAQTACLLDDDDKSDKSDPEATVIIWRETGWGSQMLTIKGTTRSGQTFSTIKVTLDSLSTRIELPYGTYIVVWNHNPSHFGHYDGDERFTFKVESFMESWHATH